MERPLCFMLSCLCFPVCDVDNAAWLLLIVSEFRRG